MSKPTCFIIMPISVPEERLADYGNDLDHFRHVLDHLHVPAVEAAGFEAIRPIAEGADLIHAEIIKNLDRADLVLCDMSTRNPNVFFELGIRTALNKPVCLVRDSLPMKVPFDTGVLNHDVYNPKLLKWVLDQELPKLTNHIVASSKRSKTTNPMWQYFGMTSRADLSTAKPNSVEEKLGLLTNRIEELARFIGKDKMPEQMGAFPEFFRAYSWKAYQAVARSLQLVGLDFRAFPLMHFEGPDKITLVFDSGIAAEKIHAVTDLVTRELSPLKIAVSLSNG